MKYVLSCLAIISALSIVRADEKSDMLIQGKEAYIQYCARCHGATGLGDGPDAKRVPVTPRNFTRGTFKFRTTASGTPPTDTDLMNVLNHGLSGSGMPNFANLGIDVKTSLIAYIKTFSDAFDQYQPQPLAEPNLKAKVDPKRGKEIYDKLQCGLCHGSQGRANGTSAPTLVDAWGAPIKPANLNQEWTYRAGSTARDIYFRLMSGIAGTPMPSYDGAISQDEAWQLANYVVSLQQHANWSYSVSAAKVSDTLPAAPEAAEWSKAPRSDVNLQSMYYAGGHRYNATVKSVAVQALVSGTDVAFRLSWNDPTKDASDRITLAIPNEGFLISDRDSAGTMNLDDPKQFSSFTWTASGSNIKSTSAYNDGQWTLVFSMPIDAKRKDILVGFAAWDGGTGESGLKRSVSQWVPLILGENPHASHH